MNLRGGDLWNEGPALWELTCSQYNQATTLSLGGSLDWEMVADLEADSHRLSVEGRVRKRPCKSMKEC